MMNNLKKNKKGFTLAEVLITMAILGVIAAILFPSILANYNEKTLRAKRQALFGRMSQAMGEMANQFRKYKDVECTDLNDLMTCTDKGSAAKFVNEGLSKVYKIAAVCDNDNFAACDIPEEITREDGTTYSLKDNGKSFLTYNSQIRINAQSFPYDINSVGVMTKNGESILLFYNPNCVGKAEYTGHQFVETTMCVNMVYDLNGGKKKPNKMGQDIGFMTVFYNNSPYVASVRPYDWKAAPYYVSTENTVTGVTNNYQVQQTFAQAKALCASLGEDVGLPSLQEAMSMLVNRELWAPIADQPPVRSWMNNSDMWGGNWVWTSTLDNQGKVATVYFAASEGNVWRDMRIGNGVKQSYDWDVSARCVYKD